jgi:cytochrome bd-type quinol oxidase subunit 2
MTNSKHIAKLLGPTLIVMPISEALNAHIWLNVSATQTYLAGTLWFIAGLSIILSHNRRALDWSVLITIMGWFALIGGLGRMFFPNPVQQGSQNTSMVFIIQMVLLAIGIILTYKAYSRESSKNA